MAMKRCPICGEKYSDTYKDCPFCEEEEALREGEQLRRSGHRTARSRQFSLITPTLIVLILIMAGLLVYLLYRSRSDSERTTSRIRRRRRRSSRRRNPLPPSRMNRMSQSQHPPRGPAMSPVPCRRRIPPVL